MPRTKAEILRGLDPTRPDTIQALIDFHRETFGGWTMMADDGEGKPAGDNPDTADKPDGKPDAKDSGNSGDDDLGAGGKKALQAEREARQRLETELKEFKNGQAKQAKDLAAALGIKTDDAKSDDAITQLKTQFEQMQRDNLVFRVVTDPKHQITDPDDLELIKAAKDEDTMRKLATRLAKKTDTDDDKAKRRFPRQDPNQGRGGDDNKKPSSVEEYRRNLEAARKQRTA